MTRTPSCRRQRPRSSFRPAPALLGVGALLLCAGPTTAQSISVSSGSATVSGTGTSVVGGGTTFGGGAGTSTTSYATGVVVGNTSGPYINLNIQDGGTIQNVTASSGGAANIAGGTVGSATDGAGGGIFISGGTVQSASTGNGQGKVIISGGTVQNVDTGTGFSSVSNTLAISGGTVGGVAVERAGVSITGGTVSSVFSVANNMQTGIIAVSGGNIQSLSSPTRVVISGGTLNTVGAGTYFYGIGSQVTGGTIQDLTFHGSAAGNTQNSISGGAITRLDDQDAYGTTVISGGSFQFITLSLQQSVINITGTGLQEIGMPTDANNDGTFQLLGTLSDGEILNAQYTQSGSSKKLQFNGVKATPSPVPEASTAVTLGGLLLLGGAGLAFRARRRAGA